MRPDHRRDTEEEFAETMDFCRRIGFARMHVFPYSARQGTPAAKMPGQVPKSIREDRARRLIALGAQMAQSYRQSFVGETVEALCEEADEDTGLCRGYTREYIPCEFPGGEPGALCRVRVAAITDEGVTGEIDAAES